MFGWKKDQAVDISPMGTYQLFALGSGGPAIGGMWNKPKEVPATFWLYYFNVDAIDAAAERVKSAGGKITNGPMEVPGGCVHRPVPGPAGRHVRAERDKAVTATAGSPSGFPHWRRSLGLDVRHLADPRRGKSGWCAALRAPASEPGRLAS